MVPCDFHRHTLKLYKRSDFDRKYRESRPNLWGFEVKCGWVTFFKGAFSFSMLYYQLQGLELYKTESPGAFQEPHRFLKAQYLSKSLIAKATSLKPPRSAAALPLLRCGWLRLRESPVRFLEKLMEDWRK